MNDWFEILLVILLVICIVLLGFIVVYIVDQAFGIETFAGNSVVLSKDAGTRTTYILVGKVLVPQIHYYWEINYNINDLNVTSDVGQSCYQKLEIGQTIGVNVRRGLFSVGYYPICD